MNRHTRPTAAVVLISMFAISGCSLLRGNPVPPPPPPAPEIAFAKGDSNRFLSRQFERDNKRKVIGFKNLTKAEATVKQASEDAQAQSIAAEEFALAQANLEEAQAIWKTIKAAPLSKPELLAQVDHKSYMATRWAQIALAESGVELGLNDLVQVQQNLERQEDQARSQKRADNLWLGQQLVPESFGGVRFAIGTSRLTADSQGAVNRLAAFMSEHPQYNLAIAGHTDSSPPSSRNLRAFVQQNPELAARSELAQQSAYNKSVSQQRAAAFAAAIVEKGVGTQRLSVEGFGQSRPIADNDSAAGRRKNRRVTATVVKAESDAGAGQSNLVQVQKDVERQEEQDEPDEQVRPKERTENRWLGQQLVPEKFGSIRFAVGTARLTADSQGVVNRLAAFMSEHPQYNLAIAGHTDSSPPSSRNLSAFVQQHTELAARGQAAQASAYNQNVSQQRAAALAAVLVAKGVNKQRLSVEGFGQSRPIADNDSAAGRRKNRRVTVTVVKADSDAGASQSDPSQVQKNVERQEEQARPKERAENRWLGQQLVPEKFGGIRFAVGTARLTADSQGVVNRLAAFLSEHPQFNLAIAGHTDSSPPSSRNLRAFVQQNSELAGRSESAQQSAYNQNVSQQRAAALAAAIVEKGIGVQRLSVEGFGQSQPIADNDSAAGRRKNRRVTATVVKGKASQASAQE